MNERQEAILEFIKEYKLKHEFSPSVRDIQKGVGIKSTSTVSSDLKILEEENRIRKTGLKSRTIEILDKNYNDEPSTEENTVNIPIVGTVAAGIPIFADQNIESTYPVPNHMVNNGKYFMLKIKGESMIDAGILDGDLVLVKQTNIANHGEIIVALIEDSATVKRLYKKNGQIMLLPENSTMEPIIPESMDVLGKVVSLFREFI